MSNACLGVRIIGPLAPHADGFRSWLSGKWYTTLTAAEQLRLMAHVSRWMASQKLDCAALTDEVAAEFIRARRRAGYRNRRSPKTLMPLLTYLRSIGVVSEPVAAVASTPAARLLQDYRRYLLDDRHLVVGTVEGYEQLAQLFLDYCSQRGVSDLAAVTAEHISGFILNEGERRRSGSAKHAVTPLRSLMRYCQLCGLTTSDLAMAVPVAAHRRAAALPRPLTPNEVTRLLASCDRRTAMGRRDYAMLLMLSRLGLRAGELAALLLDDVDWRCGEIDIPGKGGRRERLPLPDDVGQALVGYLRRGRPSTCDRSLFVRFCAPRTGLDSSGVTRMVHAAGARAGVSVTGAHQLRHTAAAQLLNAGAPLSEISQLLRHRRPATTAIYAKVDFAALRPLARQWPVGAR
jgi:integrase/recombinase XerD